VDVIARNIEGRIPLYYAVEEFSYHLNQPVVKLLVTANSRVNTRDNSGVSPVEITKKKAISISLD
jgi:ankyrin repeat protein